jgi:Tfp pilus assembly protein PilV
VRLLRGARGRQRGVTLLEIMISMAVVMVGLLALVRVLSVASKGSASALHFTQGQARAQQVLESISMMPKGILSCLQASADPNTWKNCETQCQNSSGTSGLGGGMAAVQSCIFVSLNLLNQPLVNASLPNAAADTTNQQYTLVFDNNIPDRSSGVTSVTGHVWQVQVTVGWNDDGTATAPFNHRVTFRTDVYRN